MCSVHKIIVKRRQETRWIPSIFTGSALHYSKPSLYSTIKCGSPISSLWDGSLRISSNPIVSSLPLKISSERFELGRNGRRWTCCTALNSICNLSGANRPWMFLSVEKFILSRLSWKFFSDNSRGWLGKSSFFTQEKPFRRRSWLSKGPLAESSVTGILSFSWDPSPLAFYNTNKECY